jgi:hypothetical protein
MKNIIHVIGAAMLMLSSCTQKNSMKKEKSIADKYFEFYNNYQIDSMATILNDNFQIRKTYDTQIVDKKTFLNSHMPYSKTVHKKYEVIEGDSGKYVVEEQSDNCKYIGVIYPTWKMTITHHNGKINDILIDKTADFEIYSSDMLTKTIDFMDWMKTRYSNEYIDSVASDDEALMKMKKTYYESRQQ